MAYSKNGFPVEQASKIGHLKLTSHPTIKQVIESFEKAADDLSVKFPAKTGSINLGSATSLQRIITVDGGQAVVPNPMRREKAIAFVQVAACMLKIDDLRYMKEHPMMDPRELSKMTESAVWYTPAVVPLSGVRIPGRTVQETIRLLVDATLTSTSLYDTLKFLVYRQWEKEWTISEEEQPSMMCANPECEFKIKLPRHALTFDCPSCKHSHRLSDYLSIGIGGPDDWAKEEAANALRDTLETLSLFHFIRKYHDNPKVMGETLFIKDGPLLLRAALSRLIEPIRSFISYIKDNGYPLHLVGVEKSGDLVGFIDEYRDIIPKPGDYFLPTVKYILEEIAGTTMSKGYRNRVSYGCKVAVRIGPDHLIAINIPSGEFILEPELSDLIGFEESVKILSELISYQYPNAIIPLILANSAASIARKPSGNILSVFADQLMPS